MTSPRRFAPLILAFLALVIAPAFAADYPMPKEGDWVAKDFHFHTGETMDVTLHYRTVGDPSGEPVLVLHGTSGSGLSMLTKDFAGELFGAGEPLDAKRYYLILPDALGTGKSTRPSSSGLRARFPRYDYDDMVLAQHRLLTEGLGVKHLRLIIGNSMGGMQAWMWAEKWPGYVDAIVPMACLPTAMSGRNWMLRRMFTQAIRRDPEWNGGDYTTQPSGMAEHLTYFQLATSGGNQSLFRQAPTSAAGDQLIARHMATPFKGDANDVLFQWESSYDYDPSPDLEKIDAAVLAINATDDERNPPELGVMEREMKRVRNGRYYLVPGSPQTRGHGTTGLAKLYKAQLSELLEQAPRH
ncbi:MAG TPA: alpha/beta fold hydrolase [Usitatibacter sp.]|nr:alpha/beta fold hydrolase [Usitatibacter sp.]